MPTPARATRRTALVGTLGTALGTWALSGCDTDDLRPHDSTPSLTPTAPAGGRTADEKLVDQVAAATAGALAVVRRARAFPALRPALGSLLQTHRAHLEVLDARPATTRPAPAGSADLALAGVRTTEQALQGQLVAAAVAAESGTLAALLESMSASLAQHLAVLPDAAS